MSATGDVECPTCGDEFGSATAVKSHHQSHGQPYNEMVLEQEYGVPADWLLHTQYHTLDRSVTEISDLLGISVCSIEKMRDRHEIETKSQRNGDYFECANCGDKKWVPESRQDRSNRVFCDMDCRREWESNRHVEVQCAWCGTPKEVHHGLLEDRERFFCNRDCQGQWLSENNTGESHPKWTGGKCVEVECDHCGGVKHVYPCAADKPHHFCGSECRAAWVSENLSGEDSPNAVEYVTVACEWCGAERDSPPSTAETRRFCGQECKYQWLAEAFSGEGGPKWSQVEVECAWCGNTFTLPKSRAERAKRHFCPGTDCYPKWRSEHRRGDDHHDYNRQPVECHTCGEIEYRPPSLIDNSERSFCSPECEVEWRTSEDYPTYQGGLDGYGDGWNERKKEAVRERDGRECQVCGMAEADHLTEYGERLHVHHITPARQFDDPEPRNAMGNLITLCREDHAKWEGVPLRPHQPD